MKRNAVDLNRLRTPMWGEANMSMATTELLPLWQRLLPTTVGMVLASYVAGWIWRNLLGFDMPSYIAGIVGGLTALPSWELLKRIRPKEK